MSDTIAKIEKYFISTSQYPLMVVVPSEEYKEVLSAFSNTPKIKVSDYCIGADKDPDTEKLQEDVKRKKGNFLLVGLGDYLANKREMVAKKTLLPYKDLGLQNNSHVVILLSPHMYQILKELHDSDPRVRIRIIIPKTVPYVNVISNAALVYGIKAYLEACEKGNSVGSVKTAREIQLVNVINTENAFDELKHKFPNEFNKLSPNSGSVSEWGKLLEDLNKSKKNIGQYLALQNFTALEYNFLDYAKKNDYTSWLYFLNLKLNTDGKNYLGLVASKASTLGVLFNIAKIAILSISVSDKQWSQYYEQRKKMLKACTDVDMADFVSKIAVQGVDRIAYLTDNTKVEKQATIVSLCEGANEEKLSVSYPDLYLYLQDFLFEDKRFTDYFSLYKKCKVMNSIDQDFINAVAEYAINRPYNLFPARSSIMSSLDDGKTVLIFLDALGVEYLGYIKEKCAELTIHFSAKVARADLPTITSINRGFFDEWQGKKETPIKDLDELKHHPERRYDYNNSPYPIHLAEELDVIKEALERAKIKLLTGECRRVVVASDHGASRLAVITPDIQVNNNGCNTKSSGRYCIGSDLPTANNIVADADGNYAVISDYARFTGSRAASVEVHGGATLEEVLVPIIEITLLNSNIEVILENNVIEISYNIIPTLVMFITPDCDEITVAVDGKYYSVEKVERSKFKVVMPELKKKEYTLNVFESQNKIASKEFTVKSKGFAERDMF